MESFRARSSSALAAALSIYYQGGTPRLDEGSLGQLDCAVNHLIVSPSAAFSRQLHNDLMFFLKGQDVRVRYFPDWEMLPFESVSPSPVISCQRIEALYSLKSPEPCILICSGVSLLREVFKPEVLQRLNRKIEAGSESSPEALALELESIGYQSKSMVEDLAQYSIRGSVLDFFPPASLMPLRLEFFAGKLDSIRNFRPDTQRSVDRLNQVDLVPVSEFYQGDDSEKQVLIRKLQSKASDLGLSRASIAELEDSVSQGLRIPGIEQINSLSPCCGATVLDHIGPKAEVTLVSPAGQSANVADFLDLVNEREEEMLSKAKFHVSTEEAFRSLEWFEESVQSRARFSVDVDSLHLVQSSVEAKMGTLEIRDNEKLRSLVSARRKSSHPFKPVAEEILKASKDGVDTILLISASDRIEKLQSLLEPYGLRGDDRGGALAELLQIWVEEKRRFTGSCGIVVGELGAGIVSSAERLQIFAEQEIFPDVQIKRTSAARKQINRLLTGESLFEASDYVVHADYGIGRYVGLKEKTVEGQKADYLLLEYAENARLYIPVENIGRVQKYVGIEGSEPRLTTLGGSAWQKARKKVEARVASLAGELLELYAQRELVTREPFGEIGEDDRSFASEFGFDETPDQANAIKDVLQDLSGEKPMDRLVCGDVGYGKTEVALRAAFKVAVSGKQVAVLVPTTVLASQHFTTFAKRFAGFPVEVGIVSRFQAPAENKEVLQKVAAGKIEIIIGTHRLLQKDVSFRDLGLLIIDEEHRFGVAHKERLKNMRKTVDVLTMTATPIPRTLQMSMLDIRDLSVIETPPVDRQLIRTFLVPSEDSQIREAIKREMAREGQVFFVHNRVQTIDAVKQRIEELVPEARIAIGHGQMKEKELEVVMRDFLERKIDILLATTIIESGLDFPNANTMIVDRADTFGLAQLYQLRGRVGRSSRRAYAYFLTSDEARISKDAKKRLQVMQALDDLGVGFKLALQDMEIRGAGNILGRDQSGNVNSVGFELYTRILKQAVEAARKKLREREGMESPRVEVEPELSIGFPAYIPPDYIPDVSQRLLLYQRMVNIEGMEDGKELAMEVEDRFGRYPQELESMIELMILRAHLKDLGIVKGTFRKGVFRLGFHPEARIQVDSLLEVVAGKPDTYKLSPGHNLAIRTDFEEPESPLALLEEIDKFMALVH